jgi:hypothetical protein
MSSQTTQTSTELKSVSIEIKLTEYNGELLFSSGTFKSNLNRIVKLHSGKYRDCNYKKVNGYNNVTLITNKLKDNLVAHIVLLLPTGEIGYNSSAYASISYRKSLATAFVINTESDNTDYYNINDSHTQIIEDTDIDRHFNNGLYYRITNFRNNKTISIELSSNIGCNLPINAYNNYSPYIRDLFTDEITNNHFDSDSDSDNDDDDEKSSSSSLNIVNEPVNDIPIDMLLEQLQSPITEPIEEKQSNINRPEIMTLEHIKDCIKQYNKQLTEPISNTINNSTKFKDDRFYNSQYHNTILNLLNPIRDLISHIDNENFAYIKDTYDKKYKELSKYNRKFKLLPEFASNKLLDDTNDCPCCLSNLPKKDFVVPICAHHICKDCLYNLQSNKCPTCRAIIED